MRDYENPTHIPSLPLKIIACSYILWFVVIPVIALARTGRFTDLPMYIALGLTLSGIGLGLLFIHRLILWFHYAFYWYIAAVAGVILMFCAGTVIVGVFSLPTIPAVSLPDSLQIFLIPGAIMGGAALIYVLLRRRPAAPTTITQPVATPPPPQPVPYNSDKAIEERRRKLGLDKK